MAQVIIYGPNESALPDYQRFAPEGLEVGWVDSSKPLDDQAADLRDVQVALVAGADVSVEVARRAPNLKLVQTSSAGTNTLDKTALGEMGIRVANNGGGNAVAVAEHTIGLLISSLRKFQLQFDAVKAGEWMSDIRAKWLSQANELAGKTVGIVGLGRIGIEVARRLQGWDCDLIYFDVFDPPPGVEEELNLTRASLDELLESSDIVSLHAPLTSQTQGMISDREFDLMKPTAVLINACRGPVIDEAALIRALQNDKIAQAGLDVLEEEPTPVDNPLLKMDNVLVTPHMAGFSQQSMEKSRTFALYNAARVVRGEEPESIVLPD
jgi:phosphoglycerate dehydrogenase-like enzyme